MDLHGSEGRKRNRKRCGKSIFDGPALLTAPLVGWQLHPFLSPPIAQPDSLACFLHGDIIDNRLDRQFILRLDSKTP